MIQRSTLPDNAASIFARMDNTMITSCLQGLMGKIYLILFLNKTVSFY